LPGLLIHDADFIAVFPHIIVLNYLVLSRIWHIVKAGELSAAVLRLTRWSGVGFGRVARFFCGIGQSGIGRLLMGLLRIYRRGGFSGSSGLVTSGWMVCSVPLDTAPLETGCVSG
jgi:hypothetical protein